MGIPACHRCIAVGCRIQVNPPPRGAGPPQGGQEDTPPTNCQQAFEEGLKP